MTNELNEALDAISESKLMLMGVSGQIMAGMVTAAYYDNVPPEDVADMAVRYAKALINRVVQDK